MAPSSKSLTCTAALLLCMAVVCSFQTAEAQCGGFQDSCEQYSVAASGVFTAPCRTASGSYQGATIDLNDHIGNSNGMLVEGAGFASSCEGLGWAKGSGPIGAFDLIASCRNTNGDLLYTTFDLSSHLVNSNGALYWNSC